MEGRHGARQRLSSFERQLPGKVRGVTQAALYMLKNLDMEIRPGLIPGRSV